MKVFTVVTKSGTVKEIPLVEDRCAVVFDRRAIPEVDGLIRSDALDGLIYVNLNEVAAFAILEYPEEKPENPYEIDAGPTF